MSIHRYDMHRWRLMWQCSTDAWFLNIHAMSSSISIESCHVLCRGVGVSQSQIDHCLTVSKKLVCFLRIPICGVHILFSHRLPPIPFALNMRRKLQIPILPYECKCQCNKVYDIYDDHPFNCPKNHKVAHTISLLTNYLRL